MKILHITHHYHPCIGGTETYIKQLAKQQQKQGHKIKILCLNKCPNNNKKLPKKSTHNKIQINRIPFINLKIYKIALQTKKHLKWADIIHIHGINFFSDYTLNTKKQHKKPIIISTHGGIYHTNKKSLIKKIYWNYWLKHTLPKANKIIADSQNDYQQFKQLMEEKK